MPKRRAELSAASRDLVRHRPRQSSELHSETSQCSSVPLCTSAQSHRPHCRRSDKSASHLHINNAHCYQVINTVLNDAVGWMTKTMGLSHTVSEINGYYGREKKTNFCYPCVVNAPNWRGSPLNFVMTIGLKKKLEWRACQMEKFDNMCIHSVTTLQHDRSTDRWTKMPQQYCHVILTCDKHDTVYVNHTMQ